MTILASLYLLDKKYLSFGNEAMCRRAIYRVSTTYLALPNAQQTIENGQEFVML